MISAATIDLAVTSAAMVFVYLVSITAIGVVQALITAQLGDTSAVDEGYLTLDPRAYYDSLGLMSLLIFGMGWARNFPFRPEALHAPFRKAKIALVYSLQPLLALVLALSAVISSIKLVGPNALLIVYQYTSLHALFRSFNIQALSEICGVSPALLVVFIMLVSMTAINTFIAVWSIISQLWDHTLRSITSNYHTYMPGFAWAMFIVPYLMFLFLFPVLHYAVLKIIMLIATQALPVF